MAKNTAQVNINVVNNAFSVDAASSSIAFVIGETLRGLDNNPKEVVTSQARFIELFGDVSPTNPFPEMCLQALKAGALLRVCKVMGAGADFAETAAIGDLFKFESLEKGAHANDLEIVISAATSGVATEFNLLVQDTETGKEELYQNLKVIGTGTTGPFSYLKPITDYSKLVKPIYMDLTSAGPDPRPVNGTYALSGGATGAAANLASYTGNAAAKTGLHAFDEYEDAYMLYAFGKNETNMAGLAAVAISYVASRGDLVYLQHLNNAHQTTSNMLAEIAGVQASKFSGLIGGGARYPNTISGGFKDMDALGEVAGIIAMAHSKAGVWGSPTNLRNGVLPSAVGVVNNFGSPSSKADLNTLSNGGVNMVINRYQSTMLWDFYSRAVGESPEKFLTVVLSQIFLKRSLQPFLESYLTRPNIPDTWKDVYYGVKPFLDGLVGSVFSSYEWIGDQFSSMNSLQLNDAVEVGQGKYQVQLKIVMVVPMVEFTLNLVMDRTENSISIT